MDKAWAALSIRLKLYAYVSSNRIFIMRRIYPRIEKPTSHKWYAGLTISLFSHRNLMKKH